MPEENVRPVWALSSGIPPAHIVRASLRVGSLIDEQGSPVSSARGAYTLYASDGLFPPEDLRLGEQLLVDCELLGVSPGHLHQSELLTQLLALDESEAVAIIMERAAAAAAVLLPGPPDSAWKADIVQEAGRVLDELSVDPDRREALLVALARKYDDRWRVAIGARGEECVADAARAELVDLGRPDLAIQVRRFGGLADSLGYDVVAPRLGGKRRLEVKTTTRDTSGGRYHFYLSRNEFDHGLDDSDWALVLCNITRADAVEVKGWCRARALAPYLPTDGEDARWISVEIEVPAALFTDGLPPAV